MKSVFVIPDHGSYQVEVKFNGTSSLRKHEFITQYLCCHCKSTDISATRYVHAMIHIKLFQSDGSKMVTILVHRGPY